MNITIKRIIGILIPHGLYNILWKAYNKIRYFDRKLSIEISGKKKVFIAVSSALYNRISKFGGERLQLEEFLGNIRTGDIVWDIGSYMGMYSIFSSEAVGISGKIYSFEPEPQSYIYLKRNCELNKAYNVNIFNFALSNFSGSGKIYSSRIDSLAIHSLEYESRLKAKGSPIQIFKGDDLIKNKMAEIPNCLKIDVEGTEISVLEGLNNTLLYQECRFLLIEVHNKIGQTSGRKIEEVRALIKKSGFSITNEIERGTEIHWICNK